jgi:hypothetical protein
LSIRYPGKEEYLSKPALQDAASGILIFLVKRFLSKAPSEN